MAWRYIQRDLQAGDILDPEDWNENVREYLEEINGALDRDNLPTASVVVGNEVDSTVFNEISASFLSEINQPLDVDTQAHQKIKTSNNVTSSSDELLICETSIQFDTAAAAAYGGANYEDGYVDADQGTLRDWLQYDFIMTVDGFEIAYAGPFTAFHKRQCIYMCGALPVEAGSHVVECSVRLYVDKDGGDTVTWYSSNQGFSPQITEAIILVNRRKR
mgnify:FL=1|tara:strand:- start:12777 stop:13430 length:654 start_codon:yes stop_codon:yes gene_type:complete